LTRRAEIAWVAVILAAAAAYWIAFRLYTGICLEDALITYRYAENLAQGRGFVFNQGERVLGTTTPLFTLMLGGFGAALGPARIPLISNALMILASAGTGLFTYLALRRFGYTLGFCLFVLAAIGFHPQILWITSGGMETPLVLMLMAASLWALAGRSCAIAAVFAALLALTRIDGAIWGIGVMAVILIGARAAFGRSVLAGAAVMTPWVVFSVLYFGSLVPHSVIAKRAIGAVGSIADPGYWVGFFAWVAPFFAASSGATSGAASSALSWAGRGLGYLLFSAGAFTIWSPGIAAPLRWLVVYPFLFSLMLCLGVSPLYFGWYLIPAAYASLLVGCIGIRRLARVSEKLPLDGRIATVPFLLVYFSVMGYQGWRVAQGHLEYQVNEDGTRRVIGEWLEANTPEEAVVAMEAIGYQGYYAKRRVIDLAGLVSPRVVALRRESHGNAEAFHKMLQELRPDYLVLRSFEVDRNAHYHGGRLFETEAQTAYFARHYEEVKRFQAPRPEVWGLTAYLTVYGRRGS